MERYESAELWYSQVHGRSFADEGERLESLRKGVEEATTAGDRNGVVFLRLGIVGRLLAQRAIAEAEEEFQKIVLVEGDRSYNPNLYATSALELGHPQAALRALRSGFEGEELSDLTLLDAEPYKVRRIRLVLAAHRIGGQTFEAELDKLVRDDFQGVRIPLRDLDPIKDDVLKVATERSNDASLAGIGYTRFAQRLSDAADGE